MSDGKPLDGKILSAQSESPVPLATFEYKNHSVLVSARPIFNAGRLRAWQFETLSPVFLSSVAQRPKSKPFGVALRHDLRHERKFFGESFFAQRRKARAKCLSAAESLPTLFARTQLEKLSQVLRRGSDDFPGRQSTNASTNRRRIRYCGISVDGQTKSRRLPAVGLSECPAREKILPVPADEVCAQKNVDCTCELCRRQFKPDESEIHHVNPQPPKQPAGRVQSLPRNDSPCGRRRLHETKATRKITRCAKVFLQGGRRTETFERHLSCEGQKKLLRKMLAGCEVLFSPSC